MVSHDQFKIGFLIKRGQEGLPQEEREFKVSRGGWNPEGFLRMINI
jgi:hypothetical protein